MTREKVVLVYEWINTTFDQSYETTMRSTQFDDIKTLALGYRVEIR